MNLEELSNAIFDKFILPLYQKYINKRNNDYEQREEAYNIEEKIEETLDKIKYLLSQNLDINEAFSTAMDIDNDDTTNEKIEILEQINPSENESGLSDLEYDYQLYIKKKKQIFEISKSKPILSKKISKDITFTQQNEIFNPISAIKDEYRKYDNTNMNSGYEDNSKDINESTTQDDILKKTEKNNYLNDPSSNFNKYNRQVLPKIQKSKERFKNSIPFLKEFNPKFLKKENIDKKIFRKFRNFVKNEYVNSSNVETSFLFLHKEPFWKDFCTKNLLPPMKYYLPERNKLLEFKSFNTKYFIWLFSQSGTSTIFNSFVQSKGTSIVSNLIIKYNLEATEQDIIPKLTSYLYSIPSIYSCQKKNLSATKQYDSYNDITDTYTGTKEPSNEYEDCNSSNNVFNLNFGKIFTEDSITGSNNDNQSYISNSEEDYMNSFNNALWVWNDEYFRTTS